MNFLNYLIRFAAAIAICFTCVGLMGFALFYFYSLHIGLTVGMGCMGMASLFQMLRLWERDRTRAMMTLITAGLFFGLLFLI